MDTRARESYNAYMREWRKKNRDKVKAYQQKYWEKKIQEQRKEA